LANEHCAFHVEMFSDPRCKIREATECVSIPRNQLSFAGFDVCERTKAVNLQRETRLNQTALSGGKAVWDASCVETCTKYKADRVSLPRPGFCQVGDITSPDFSIFQYVTRW